MYFQCQFFSIVNLFFSGSGSFCRFLSTVVTLSTTPGLYFTQTAKLSVFLKLSSQCLHFSSFGVGNFGISITVFLPRWLTRFVNPKIIRVTCFLVFCLIYVLNYYSIFPKYQKYTRLLRVS